MPTKRTRRAQGTRLKVSPAMLARLQLGQVPVGTPGRTERFFWHDEQLEAAWRELRTAILAAWTASRPGTRPWAWWRYEAAEPRRCLVGASLLGSGPAAYLERRWRGEFGIPAARRVATREDSRFVVESEAACLRRLRQLLPEERRALAPAAFEPVDVPLETTDHGRPPHDPA